MKRLAWVVATLALAGPAAAETKAVALDDSQLDQVAAGCDTHGTTTPTTTPTTNTSTPMIVSPIVVNQTAVAANVQKAWAGNANGKGKAKAYGHVQQTGTAVALNSVHINYNYHPKF
jgi:hypothetical protein